MAENINFACTHSENIVNVNIYKKMKSHIITMKEDASYKCMDVIPSCKIKHHDHCPNSDFFGFE